MVTGDGRQDGKNGRPEDKNGVNALIVPELAQAVVKEHAKFLVFTGDLVLGDKDDDTFKKQLYFWRELMKPVYDAHIPVLAVRGNHETHAPNGVADWNEVFSGPYAMPQNGPAGEKNLSFTYSLGPVTVIGIDEYSVGKEQVNQPWLDSVLGGEHGPLLFATGHEMAFYAGHHTDGLMAHPDARDAFVKSLVKAGALAFFCGHDHFYDHMEIKAADGSGTLQQYVAGTAGAPYYDGLPYQPNPVGWQLTQVKHIGSTNGYTVVEVDGNTVTMTFKGRVGPGKYVPMETNRFAVPAKGRAGRGS